MTKRSRLYPFVVATLFALADSACSQTPIIVPLRSMERPKDVAFVCLFLQPGVGWQGVPIEKCRTDVDGNSLEPGEFRLHAIVTQVVRGELAVVDLGRGPKDTAQILKVDPRIPGYTFVPVSAVPTDVVADPAGRAVFVASGRDTWVDIVPSEMLRGPIDTNISSGKQQLPWPRLTFTLDEGSASKLTVVRDPGPAGSRLYVSLPDAKAGPKIAVFDLSKSALVPARIGDITLNVDPALMPGVAKVDCSTTPDVQQPWWKSYDTCRGVKPAPAPAPPAPAVLGRLHLAGVAVAGGTLFAANDAAPYIHVFDVAGGRGREIQRIEIGTKTSELAVSPVLPDEVDLRNAPAIEVCEARGWIGDGRDHSADDVSVKTLLNGRCRAHRYVYAIDLTNSTAGDGSIAVIDVPITFETDAAGVIKRNPDGTPVSESLDLFGLEIAQPMSCDSPFFAATRIPLGAFGLGGLNAVPARGVTFVQYDPPSPRQLMGGARCHPWAVGQHPLHKVKDALDKPTGALRPEYDELAGLDAAERLRRLDAATSWQNTTDARRLRGTFAMVVLSNGAVVVVDVDDRDSLCRGPKLFTDATLFVRDEDKVSLGDNATGENFARPVRRHHPRSTRFFADDGPLTTNLVLSNGNTTLTIDLTTVEGRAFPHFALLNGKNSDPRDITRLIEIAPDNPYALTTEVWSATYQGALPGFIGNAGSFVDDAGKTVLLDPAAHFCRRGTEAEGPSSPVPTPVGTHDVIQIVDDVCRAGTPNCSQAQRDACINAYGAFDDLPLKPGRDLLIEEAFEDHAVIANPPANLKQCFPSLTKYTVRANNATWVVIGSSSGYLHRRTLVDPSKADSACTIDDTRPGIYQGRVIQLPGLDNPASEATSKLDMPLCDKFVNPSFRFAIRAGTSSSVRDMRFAWGSRYTYQPVTIGGGSLPTSIRYVASIVNGVDLLGWNQVAVIDAVDRGLTIFSVGDITFGKVIN